MSLEASASKFSLLKLRGLGGTRIVNSSPSEKVGGSLSA